MPEREASTKQPFKGLSPANKKLIVNKIDQNGILSFFKRKNKYTGIANKNATATFKSAAAAIKSILFR